ncbi:MAG TPA: hypothetical protein VFJ16_01915 [Longimicrobium sp.]|nr:hypothetical protein [Longimicrobium sp.]
MPQDQAQYEENGGSLGGGGRSSQRIAPGSTQTRFETSADNGGSLGGGGR